MNNASVRIEDLPQPDHKEHLRAEEARVTKLLDALRVIQGTDQWKILQEMFDHLHNVLERDLKEEARKANPDTNKLNRLTGQLEWAEKYDLTKLENRYRIELQGIRTT